MAFSGIVALIPYWLHSFKEKKDRSQASTSELITISIASCFLIFNVVSVESNFAVGYLAIGIISAYVGGILLSTLFMTLKSLYKHIRIKLIKRAYNKQRALF